MIMAGEIIYSVPLSFVVETQWLPSLVDLYAVQMVVKRKAKEISSWLADSSSISISRLSIN
jgi:hypothetical protein